MTTNLALQKHQDAQSDKMTRLDDSLFSPALAPHYEALAIKLAKTSVIPKGYIGKPMDLFVAMAMGFQLGLPVEQAIQDIAVINGRPCMYGDGLLAVVMNHPEFDDIIEEAIYSGVTISGYRCTVKRRGKADYTKEFTLDMARKAKLLSKPGPWTDYPDRMMQMRARGFALRDRFPDALRGIKPREEVEDYLDAEYYDGEPIKAPGMTQTERAKQNYIQRKGLTHEPVQNVVSDPSHQLANDKAAPVENAPFVNPVKADPNKHVEPMDDVGNEKDQNTNESSGHERCTKEQIDRIEGLMFINDFPPVRLRKALNHYGAALITDLNATDADRFIAILEKEEQSSEESANDGTSGQDNG